MTVIGPGACSVALRQLDATGVIDAIVAAGLEAIEWGGDVHVPPGDLVRAARIAQQCAAVGLGTPSYGSYACAGQGADFGPVLDTADALGVGTIRVWAGPSGSADTDARGREAVALDLARWARAANGRAMRLAVEFHAGTLTDTAESTLRLLDDAATAGAPDGSLFTYWQPRDGLAGAADLAELAAVADRLAHLHVFWWRSWFERHPLAEGRAFWREAFDLAASSPTGPSQRWAFIEFVPDDDPTWLARDAATLIGWLGDGRSA